jgi:hypothetical protein
MKKTGAFCILFLFFLFVPSFRNIGAQPQQTKSGIPVVLAGVFHVLEYADRDEDKRGGATFDHAFSWKQAPDSPEAYSFTFSDFRYTYLFDSENQLYFEKDKYCRVVLNGTLTLEASGRLNGRLSVGGETGLSSLSFDNLSVWESSDTGGITADGVSYTQAEITRIIDDLDYHFGCDFPIVTSFEMECIYAGLLTFIKTTRLTWENSEGIPDSLPLMEGDLLPLPEGSRASDENGEISGVAKKGGIEISYKDFPVDSDGEYFPFTVRGNVFISAKRTKKRSDIESMTFSGSLDVTGLPFISRAELKDFTLQETEGEDFMTGSGLLVINGKEYQGAEVLDSLMRLFR